MKVDDKPDDMEWVSAIADGELAEHEFSELAATLGTSDEARAAWHAYHVIGDVLRCADLPDCTGDRLFVDRLRARLATQALDMPLTVTDGQPPVQVLPADPVARPGQDGRFGRHSANDPAVPWRWLAMAASLAAVAVLGWQVSKPSLEQGAVLAGTESAVRPAIAAPPAATAQAPVMLRDPRLDELLAAHRQSGGASALPTSAGFLRNATFEQPGR